MVLGLLCLAVLLTKRMAQINLEQVNQVVARHIKPEQLTWLVVGDLSKFEQKVRDAGFGEVIVLDTEGNVVKR